MHDVHFLHEKKTSKPAIATPKLKPNNNLSTNIQPGVGIIQKGNNWPSPSPNRTNKIFFIPNSWKNKITCKMQVI